MSRPFLSPEKLLHLYEALAERFPRETRPLLHLRVFSHRSEKEILAIAWMLDIPTDGEETIFTNEQAAAITRELFDFSPEGH